MSTGNEAKNINKPMFWAGMSMMGVAAIVLVVVEKDLGAWPAFMAIMGIVAMGASGYRPMK